ncbi:hypothetical protein MASR2M18_12580 [Ignavibacteria bacterium]|nr:hypothetical protein [Bacteroidota bacterium]MCZ2132211.1 hypothetical protein [Bacteroidota bacterium]
MKIRKFQIFSIFSIAVVFMAITAAAQERVAVFPFRNMDGQMEYNIWRERLSDSLTIALQQEDMEYKAFYIVPSDSVAEILAAMNLDPNNPQYESDKWKAATQLNVSRVITGNFNIQSGGKMSLNVYIYDIETKLPDINHQVKNLYRDVDKVLETIPKMVKKLLPALKLR